MWQRALSGSGGGGGIVTDTFTTSSSGKDITLGFEPSLVIVDIECATAGRHNLYYWTADNNQTFVAARYNTAGSAATSLTCYNFTVGGITKTSNGFRFEANISSSEENNRPAVYYAG